MRYEHIDGVEVAAQFSREGESRFRNRLEIALQSAQPSGKTVCAVMQDPSYAGEDVADKSVQLLEKVVFQKGLPEFEEVRRLIVVNQFAYSQTNDFEGLPHQIGELNDAATSRPPLMSPRSSFWRGDQATVLRRAKPTFSGCLAT